MIEDVATGADQRGKFGAGGGDDPSGWASVVHRPTPVLRDIYSKNDVFFADTMVGNDWQHNNFVRQQIRRRWMKDPVNHNGHLVVIRKRESSR